ncbi:hypothetical protein [Mucilaginibacter conchicola]|nr:hypothetical protein [Mucilaginibacter conchicola]
MLHFILSVLFTCLVTTSALAQAPTQPVDVPSELKRFIPRGYEALNVTKGNLNKDAYADAIMVLFKTGEEKTSDVIDHPEKRPLLILTGNADGSYKLDARSDNAVYCVDCGGQMGDPFTGITIKNGYFSVEHYGGSGWRWTRIITFKYSPADKGWYLFKDGGESYHVSDPEKSKTTVKTVKSFGKVPFSKFDIYKEK